MVPIWVLLLLGLLMGIALVGLWLSQRKIRSQLHQSENFNHILQESITQTERQINFWQSTCDNMQRAVIWINSSNQIINMNKAACELYQYESDEFLGLELTKLELNEADYPVVFRGDFWQKLATELTFTSETVHRRKNGKSFWAEIYMSKIYNGQETYVCAIIRNTSKRKRRQFSEKHILEQLHLAETKQKQNEQNIRAIIESTQNEIFVVNNDFNLLVANSAFLNRVKQQTGILVQQGESITDYVSENIKQYQTDESTDSQVIEEVISLEEGEKKIY